MLCLINARGVPGLAGAVVCDRAGKRYALSCHHVVFGRGAVAGDKVFALSDEDGQLARLGRADRGQLGCVSDRGVPRFLDCALVSLDLPDTLPGWARDGLARLGRAAGEPAPGMLVSKEGHITGLTRGVVVSLDHYDAPTIEGRGYQAHGQMLVRSLDEQDCFCAPGESGAAVVDEEQRVIGFLWGATGAGEGVAFPVQPALAFLEVELEVTR